MKKWNGILTCNFTVGQNKIKSRSKNSWNQINQFDEILFLPNSIFCNFKNGEKSLKLPKMQFHEFFAWTFLYFLVRCEFIKIIRL